MPDDNTPGRTVAAGAAADPSGRWRRRLLFSTVAAGAIAGGAAFNWRRLSALHESASAERQLWSQSFETPGGTVLALQTLLGRPLLVNFWATWCPPCVEELPMLDAFYRARQPSDLQIVAVAIDQPAAVRRFLQTTPLSFPIALAGATGTQLTRQLGNLAGGLPFSVWLDRAGAVRQRKLGQLKADEVRGWAAAL